MKHEIILTSDAMVNLDTDSFVSRLRSDGSGNYFTFISDRELKVFLKENTCILDDAEDGDGESIIDTDPDFASEPWGTLRRGVK